jgi:hypothetical protein
MKNIFMAMPPIAKARSIKARRNICILIIIYSTGKPPSICFVHSFAGNKPGNFFSNHYS